MKIAVDCFFNSQVAKRYGIVGALLLNRISWSMDDHEKKNKKETYFHDDKWWMRDRASDFHAHFNFICLWTIKTTLKTLEADGILLTRKPFAHLRDHTKWYSIDQVLLKQTLAATDSMETQLSGSDSVKIQPSEGVKIQPSEGVKIQPSSSTKSLTKSLTKSTDTALSALPPPSASGSMCAPEVEDLNQSHLEGHTIPLIPIERVTLSEDITRPKKSKIKPIVLKNKEWLETDEFSEVFSNLTKISICMTNFDTEEYRQWLKSIMDEESLTIDELVKTSSQWQVYHNDAKKKPTSPKGSFRTWINFYVERRSKTTPKKKGPNPGDRDYDYGEVPTIEGGVYA